MNKSELLQWLHTEHQHWEALLERIQPARMEQVGVNRLWSMKDLIAHLIPDAVRSIAELQAAQRNEPQPPPPWPAQFKDDDEINAWLYELYHERSVRQILDEADQVLEQLFAIVAELPEEVEIEAVRQGKRQLYLVHLGGQRIQPGYFFDHFHDDHEEDVLAWLSQVENG